MARSEPIRFESRSTGADSVMIVVHDLALSVALGPLGEQELRNLGAVALEEADRLELERRG